MEILPLRLGQLVGPEFQPEESDEYDLTDLALKHLVAKLRPRVTKAVLAGFGGVSGLFLALWRTSKPLPVAKENKESEEGAESAEGQNTESHADTGRGSLDTDGPPRQLMLALSDQKSDSCGYEFIDYDLLGERAETDDEYDDDDQDEDEDTDDHILNVVTDEKMVAFEWIDNGCPALDLD